MIGLLIFIFVVVCLLLTITILLQSSSSEGLGGIAGGLSSSNPIFGRGSASFMQRLTTGLAIAYMLLALLLAKFWATSPAPKLKVKPESTTTQSVQSEKEEAEGKAETQGQGEEGNTGESSEK